MNTIECREYNSEGKQTYCNSWVTDIEVTQENAYQIARGGRNRWSIENETFNTLKNQGYHFEHNFGHGKKNLCSILGLLMMLAFLIDQVEQRCCHQFHASWEKMKSKVRLWERIRMLFTLYDLSGWDELYGHIISLVLRKKRAPPCKKETALVS